MGDNVRGSAAALLDYRDSDSLDKICMSIAKNRTLGIFWLPDVVVVVVGLCNSV